MTLSPMVAWSLFLATSISTSVSFFPAGGSEFVLGIAAIGLGFGGGLNAGISRVLGFGGGTGGRSSLDTERGGVLGGGTGVMLFERHCALEGLGALGRVFGGGPEGMSGMTRPLDFGVVVLPKTVSKCFIAAAFPASAAPHNRSHGGGASGGRGTPNDRGKIVGASALPEKAFGTVNFSGGGGSGADFAFNFNGDDGEDGCEPGSGVWL